ncbi:MAG: phage holin family protein [Terracoccus sp.]
MSTDPRQERTLGQLVAAVSQDLSTLVRGEIALAKAEVSAQVKKAGVGGVLLAAAAVVAFYSVYFIFTTIAEGIVALGLARWLSFLIVTLLMLAIAAVLGLLGVKRMKTVEPAPERTIANAQQTVAGVKAAVAHPGTMAPGARPDWDSTKSAATTAITTQRPASSAAKPVAADPARDASPRS